MTSCYTAYFWQNDHNNSLFVRKLQKFVCRQSLLDMSKSYLQTSMKVIVFCNTHVCSITPKEIITVGKCSFLSFPKCTWLQGRYKNYFASIVEGVLVVYGSAYKRRGFFIQSYCNWFWLPSYLTNIAMVPLTLPPCPPLGAVNRAPGPHACKAKELRPSMNLLFIPKLWSSRKFLNPCLGHRVSPLLDRAKTVCSNKIYFIRAFKVSFIIYFTIG